MDKLKNKTHNNDWNQLQIFLDTFIGWLTDLTLIPYFQTRICSNIINWILLRLTPWYFCNKPTLLMYSNKTHYQENYHSNNSTKYTLYWYQPYYYQISTNFMLHVVPHKPYWTLWYISINLPGLYLFNHIAHFVYEETIRIHINDIYQYDANIKPTIWNPHWNPSRYHWSYDVLI